MTSAVRNAAECVTNDQIVKGFQHQPDKYVVISPDDLAKVKLPTNKSIEILGFVDAASIPATFFDSPYFAGPDGPVAQRAFDVFRAGLKSRNKVALGKVTLGRGREEFVAIAPQGRGIIVYKLRYAAEVRDINEVPGLGSGEAVNAEELKIAETLIDSMTTNFDEVEIADRYQATVVAMINARIAGTPLTETAETPTAPAPTNILAALQASLKVVGGTETVKANVKAKATTKAATKKSRKAA